MKRKWCYFQDNMAEEDPANVFAFPDYSLSSKLLALPSNPEDQFFGLSVENGQKTSDIVDSELISKRDTEFFKIPDEFAISDLNGHENETDDLRNVTTAPLHDTVLHDLDFIDELWYEGEQPPTAAAEYKTWDSFFSDAPQRAPLFITEAGPLAYDAAITDEDDPLGLVNTDHLVVQSGAYLAALLALALGRGSVFFEWDASKSAFVPVVYDMRISGYSTGALHGIQSSCLTLGTTTRFLSSYVQLTYSTRASAVRISLAKAVDVLLLAIQQQFGERSKQVRSLLQLQSLVEPIETMLVHLRALVHTVSRMRTDEQVLSHIFSETEKLDNDHSLLPVLMCEILSRVTEPWTDFVEKWIGVTAEEGSPMTKDGPGKSFVKVEDISKVDDFGFETEERDYVLDEDRVPSFVPPDIMLVMFEAGKNLRLLRTHHPNHPLCHPNTAASSNPPALKWLFDWESIDDIRRKVTLYEKSMLHRILGTSSDATVLNEPEARVSSREQGILRVFGNDAAHLEQQLLASIQALDQAPTVAATQDTLSGLVEDLLLHGKFRTNTSTFDLHWSLIPLHSFGPLVTTQARLVNREYMKLLFSAHDLKENLRVQKEFQLLGNGMFCSRLSHALFDPDLETAERQVGVAMSGGVMGLRMNGRETWPPASSELRLALMGVLSDTYLPNTPQGPSSSKNDMIDLPGDLSFALRDLSPEEIDRCMDPTSLEALDFLRLAYKTPAPLSPIMTPGILIKYDKIFKLLLRVLRLLYVVGQLSRDTSRMQRYGRDTGDVWLRFRFEAQHLVQSVATYFFDTGIHTPWLRFETWLDEIQSELTRVDIDTLKTRVVSPDEVREEHEKMLDRIMSTLLLRKRQQPVLTLLEDIFRLTLKFSRQVQLEVSGKVEGNASQVIIQEFYQSFKKKVGVFITVCHGLSEKKEATNRGLRRDKMSEDGGRDSNSNANDENTIDRLLVRLDMLGYYSRPRF
ncbi:Spc97/Spc98 family protein [Xylaria arbuscula]|nr:Spc97/Spc98 family protein [Xylaria arbuscula]